MTSTARQRFDPKAIAARATRADAATPPILPALLASGGDERLAIDHATGRNRYGTCATPRPDEIWLSSSTASAPSPRGYAAAAAALDRLLAAPDGAAALFDGIRSRLLALYGIAGAACILAPSGTDCELLALALTRLGHDRDIVNIVIAPAETGSGVPLAARGAAYLATTALGDRTTAVGTSLAGFGQGARVAAIPVRREDGQPHAPDWIEAEARRAIAAAIAADADILLHVLDATKTGLAGLGRDAARRLRALAPDRVTVAVDACQLRCSAAAIRQDLADGFLVMISGSKFAAGPAFCGALLLPPGDVGNREKRLPIGLHDVSALHDWPVADRHGCAVDLPANHNLGLGLRWEAALAEIEAFAAIPPALIEQACALFEAEVRALVAARPQLTLVEGLQGDRASTIFTILAAGEWSSADGAAHLHRALREPGGDRHHHPCHLGQPVAIGSGFALRVCASMPILGAIATAMIDGTAAAQAFAGCRRDLATAFAALDAVIGEVMWHGVSLDPENWDAFRGDAHRALDLMIDHVRDVRDRPVWLAPSPRALAACEAGLPRQGQPLGAVIDAFGEDILPFGTGNLHPRFMGWVHGAGTPVGMVAEMLAAGLNLNCGGRNHIGLTVERQITRWMAGVFGFPADASGIFLTGTSIANFVALLVARDKALGHEVRSTGLAAAARLTVYTSSEAHGCVRRAVEMAGIGSDRLRSIPADADGRIDVSRLVAAIAEDRERGYHPFLVVGTAGTVNAGAIDDLPALALLCAAEGLWFHVDAAFGALCALSPRLKPLVAGIERADSIAFDFHKWLHLPYDAGFLICRDRAAHRGAFADPAAYLARAQRGLAAGDDWPHDFGPDLSRGFRALKAWFAFKTFGADRLAASIENGCALARLLERRIAGSPLFELRAPVTLNIVCFGLRDGDGALEREIVMDLHESGIAAPSTTSIAGRTVIRCAILNHRTTPADIEILVDALEAAARSRLAASLRDDAGGAAAGATPGILPHIVSGAMA